jgi:DNA polymerase elongation subunit (family B)
VSEARPPIVFGWDATSGILACQLDPDGRHVRLYRRVDARTVVSREPLEPFLLAADDALVRDAPGLLALERLDGAGELAWYARFASWADALAGRDRCRELSRTAPNAADAPYLFPGDVSHTYLLTTGRTSFGGMRFGDLRRLALDIEVITTEGFEFPNAARDGDRIVAVALADSTGFRHVVRGDRLDEPALLRECGQIIHERDPDVIEGHNIFRFDLEYIEARARRHGVTLDWGRDGSPMRGRPSRLSIAERSVGFRRYEIAGRHIVDTWMLALLRDAGTRDLPSLGLKDIARHLGVAAADRTYVEGGRISKIFAESPDELMAYAGDDAVETLGVGAVFATPYFAQAQFLPFDYQSTVLRGAAAKIDSLLLRAYLQRRHAVPSPRPSRSVGGGYTAVFQRGVAQPVLHVDVTSLYPSLMLSRDIAPESDALGVFPALLAHLRDVRVEAKRLSRSADAPDERRHMDAMQQSFKILINAFYGYLAFGTGHWNDFEAANRVTEEGRGVVTAILDALTTAGATPVEADTDGVYFVPPPAHRDEDDDALLSSLARALPPGIALELDGRFPAMLSYKMKTYALLDARGRVTLKGSGFRSRGLEPFQRQLIEELVGLFVRQRGHDAKAVVDRWLNDFAAHRVPVKAFARTETLQDSLDQYRDLVRAGRAPSAAYEVALHTDRPWSPGDQISYYVVGRSASVTVHEYARLASEWNASSPDENVEFYQSRVWDIWERFKTFAERPGLYPYTGEEEEKTAQLSLF